MKSLLKTIILLFLSSCIREGDFGDTTFTTLINNTGHNIEVQQFRDGQFKKVTFINNNNKHEFIAGSGEPGGPVGPWIKPKLDSDSIWVIYYEKASIMHTVDVNSPVTKSLMLESSYEGGKVKEGVYEFTYTFTPSDFKEALEFGD